MPLAGSLLVATACAQGTPPAARQFVLSTALAGISSSSDAAGRPAALAGDGVAGSGTLNPALPFAEPASAVAADPAGYLRGRMPKNHGGFGIEAAIGLNGVSGALGYSVNRFVGVRVGGTGIRYSGTFQEDAATINAYLQFAYGKAQIDFYPLGGRFHISPLVVIANNTHIEADVNIDPNQQFDLNGEQFRGSATDPLHGTGRVDLSHYAPGVTIGSGNIAHGKGHFVFPVEAGFYHVGQPKLGVVFTGSVCDVSNPIVGCQQVQNNPDFQTSLNAFVARNNHNLTYAKYIPILSFGVGYRF